jgi:hypothetical protein
VWRIRIPLFGGRSIGGGQAGADGERGARDDGEPAHRRGPADRLLQQEGGPGDGHHGLDELDLTHLRHRSDREAAVPGEEAEVHAHGGEVREREPWHGRRDRRLCDRRCHGQRRHHGQGDEECPGDGLPRSEFAGEQAAFRVADRRGDDGAEQQQVGGGERTQSAVLQGGEDDSCDRTEAREHPERSGGALARSKHDGDRCRGRKEADHDGAVTGGRGGHREGGQQREPRDDSARHDHESGPLRSGGDVLPSRGEGDGREECRDDGAARADEQRREIARGDACEREREGERGDAERPPPQSRAR